MIWVIGGVVVWLVDALLMYGACRTAGEADEALGYKPRSLSPEDVEDLRATKGEGDDK